MQNKKQKVALSSVFASGGLTVIKLIVGVITGSIGIISEAAHSALDLGAAGLTYYAVSVSDEPADERHHYGHGKIESVSAFIETALLFVTSAWIVYEAVHRLIDKSIEVEVTWYAFAVMLVSIVVDFSRSRALYKTAKATNSQALEADALHFRSDIYSSGVVVLGLAAVLFGIKGADAIAAIGVALFVIHAGYKLGRRTIDVLTDTAPLGMDKKIKEIVEKIDGVMSLERLRARPAGAALFIDMVVAINRQIPMEQVDKILQKIQAKITAEYKQADVVVHTKPVAVKNESLVDRVQMIAVNHGLTAHNVEVYTAGNKKIVNLDLELDNKLNLEEAHKKTSHIEDAIHYEFGKITEVNIHLDPHERKIAVTDGVSETERLRISQQILGLKSSFPTIIDIHNITIQQADGGYVISCHAVFNKKMPLAQAHDMTHELKRLIRAQVLGAEKVLVHAEPDGCV